MNRKRFLTRWEWVAVLALAAGLLVWLLLPKAAGQTVEVRQGDRLVGSYPLNGAARVPVTGAHGLTLTVVIEDGSVRVEDARCPDLICQHHAPITQTGESIVCLPAQVVITVKGGSAYGPDAVSG